MGTYWTAPEGCRSFGSDEGPSRTAVDFDGGVWVANRHNIREIALGPLKGHVVKIGNGLAYQWIDRNNDGILDTSTGTTPLNWTNDDTLCEASDIQYADDELILIYMPVPPIATRTLAVNRKNNVWVGGSFDRSHGLLDWRTGGLADENGNGTADFSFTAYNCGGYGGLVDSAGILWSARGDGTSDKLLRFDPATNNQSCITIASSYGLGIDTAGNIWNTQWLQDKVSKIDADGSVINSFDTDTNSRGVVSVPTDNTIWVANSGADNVTRMANSGSPSINIGVGAQPTGVAVDSSGFVWVINRDSNPVHRINPSTLAISTPITLPSGSRSYSYSDMTGVPLYHTTAPAGVLATTTDESQSVWVEGVSWTAAVGDGTISAWVRAADTVTDLGKELYWPAGNDADILCQGIRGRYVQIRFQLNALSHSSTWPVLNDFDLVKLTSITDCNDNDVPDHCEVEAETSPDCNDDGIPDECQLVSNDCNSNGIPDECEDCNTNGKADECDIADSTSCDEDDDGVPDECFACCLTSNETCVNLVPEGCTGIGTSYLGITCGPGCQCLARACCVEDACCDVVDCACTATFSHSGSISCSGSTCLTGACCTSTGCRDSNSGFGTIDKAYCDGFIGAFQYIGGATCSGSPNICTLPASCPAGTISKANSMPPDLVVDARFPHSGASATPKWGIGYEPPPPQATLTQDKIIIKLAHGGSPVLGANRAECWCLCEEFADPVGCNSITSVDDLTGGEYRIHLARPITTHAVTTISYKNSADHMTYISHPGNVNGDSTTNPADIIALIDHLNGVALVPWGLYGCDINRSGACSAPDISGEIDLLNGASAFDVWSGTSRPNYLTSICPSAAGCVAEQIACSEGFGEMQQDSSEASEVADVQDVSCDNACIADYVVVLLTNFDGNDSLTHEELIIVVDALSQWCADHFTAEERSSLTAILADPSRVFAGEVGANAAASMVKALTP